MIQIQEKPDWVSWEDIRQCLMGAHAENRANGIIMSHYQWPAEKIRESIGDNGVMLVALDGRKVVGTAAMAERYGKAWYNQGRFAYLCYDGVLPEYSGQGIYKRLINRREEIARSLSYEVLLLDTHIKNKPIQEIALKNGYRYVRFFRAASKDHYSVMMVKWLSHCPFSKTFCCARYHLSKIKTVVSMKLLRY